MGKTINFCGDSFCNFNTKSKVSWCAQLADKLGVEVVGTGWGGTAYEYAIKSFKHDADITVFCWTDSSRLYHKDYIVNYKSGSRYYKTYKTHEMLSLLGEMFYRTLYNEKYFDEFNFVFFENNTFPCVWTPSDLDLVVNCTGDRGRKLCRMGNSG